MFDPESFPKYLVRNPWGRFLRFAQTPAEGLGIGHGTGRFGAVSAGEPL